jgi:galactokinase
VTAAVEALEQQDPARFGALLLESHASLRDRLKVSSPSLDALVETAMRCGALGARLTGAGFGGCAVIFTLAANRDRLRRELTASFYAGHSEFRESQHLIDAEPARGALALPSP